MNYLQHLLHSKGKANLLRRAFQICQRFGLTSRKITRDLHLLQEISKKHRCEPTIFLTADLLDRQGDLIHRISEDGAHFGIHGHYHIDFASLSPDSQTKGIAVALSKFTDHGVPVNGFRGPFLRYNDDTAKAARENGLSWVSHSVMVIEPGPWVERIHANKGTRSLINDFYIHESHEKTPSLPSWGQHCLQIPVSLPDDEVLVDRLGILDPNEIAAIWCSMLNITTANGELLNLLIHPERCRILAESLDVLLERAAVLPSLWVASLDEIARWWRERAAFSFQIDRNSPTSWRVVSHSTARAAVQIQDPGGRRRTVSLDNDGSFTLESSLRPTIHMPPDFCDQPAPCLINEGFLVERDSDPSACSFVLTGTCSRNMRALLTDLNGAKGPLVSFGRWPKPHASALCLSMDLDAFTVFDFVRRLWHFRDSRDNTRLLSQPSGPQNAAD